MGHPKVSTQSYFRNRSKENTKPHQLLGLPFSQYGKIESDFRFYKTLGPTLFASRVNSGLVVPYGNSITAPFSKQFFTGGANSIRVFQVFRLGPGNTKNEEAANSLFFDQRGEIKLEANAEYRFPLISYFKGAIFFLTLVIFGYWIELMKIEKKDSFDGMIFINQ